MKRVGLADQAAQGVRLLAERPALVTLVLGLLVTAALFSAIRNDEQRRLEASTEFAEVSNAINRAEVFRYVAKPWEGDELKKIFLLAFERRDQILRERAPAPAAVPPGAVSMHDLEAQMLEDEEPGITKVRRAPDGSIYFD